MKFHAETGKFRIKCNHCQQYVYLSKGGFRSWHYALIGGLSGFSGCIAEDIMDTYNLGIFTIFYVSGYVLLWLIALAINSIRVKDKK